MDPHANISSLVGSCLRLDQQNNQGNIAYFGDDVEKIALPSTYGQANILQQYLAIDFICEFCDSRFHSNLSFASHVRVCYSKKKFSCDQCPATFNVESNFRIHKISHDGTQGMACPECHKIFKRVASLLAHLRLHQIDDFLTCEKCSAEFEFYNEYKVHTICCGLDSQEDFLPENPPIACKQCSVSFKRPLDLMEHKIMHKKIRETMQIKFAKRQSKSTTPTGKKKSRKICPVCNKSFSQTSALKRHESVHTGEKNFKCDVCEKSFSQQGALLFHKAKHMEEKPHKCQLCGAQFAQKGNLRTHVTRVHPLNPRAGHLCSICSCVLPSMQALNAHLSRRHKEMLQYTGGPPCPSSVEGVEFIDVDHLPSNTARSHAPVRRSSDYRRKDQMQYSQSVFREQNEIGTLPNDRNFGQYCNYSNMTGIGVYQNLAFRNECFSNKPKISKDKQSDSLVSSGISECKTILQMGKKFWLCPVCGKQLSRSSDLTRHIRIHTFQKPYPCDVCGLVFSLRSTRDQHLRAHQRAKWARCYLCFKELCNASALRGHLNAVHAQRRFECPHCAKLLKSKFRLHTHICPSLESTAGGFRAGEKDALGHRTHAEPMVETSAGFVRIAPKASRDDVRTLDLQDSNGQSVRPYACADCPLRFRRAAHLLAHASAHARHQAKVAGRAQALQPATTTLHATSRYQHKSFKCADCPLWFSSRRSLHGHRFVHERRRRPFTCPLCWARFATGVLCRRHIKRHAAPSTPDVQTLGIEEPGATTTWAPYHNDTAGWRSNHSNVESWPDDVMNPQVRHPVCNISKLKLRPSTVGVSNFLADSQALISSSVIGQSIPVCDVSNFHRPSYSTTALLRLDDFEVHDEHRSADVFEENRGFSEFQDLPQYTPLNSPILSGQNLYENSLPRSLETPRVYEPSIPNRFSSEISEFSYFSGNGAQHGIDVDLPPHLTTYDDQPDHSTKSALINASPAPSCPIISSTRTVTIGRKIFSHVCSKCGALFTCLQNLLDHVTKMHAVVAKTSSTTNQKRAEFSTNQSALSTSIANWPTTVPSRFINRTAILPGHDSSAGRYQFDPITDGYGCGSGTVKPTVFCDGFADLAAESEPAAYKNSNGEACEYCGVRFKKPVDLRRHVRTHTGEKPFACGQCPRRFTVRSTLTSHERTHARARRRLLEAGRAPCVCETCGFEFASQKTLRRHVNSVHPDEVQSSDLAGIVATCSKVVPFNASQLKSANFPLSGISKVALRFCEGVRRLAVWALSEKEARPLKNNAASTTLNQDALIVDVDLLRNLAAQNRHVAVPIGSNSVGNLPSSQFSGVNPNDVINLLSRCLDASLKRSNQQALVIDEFAVNSTNFSQNYGNSSNLEIFLSKCLLCDGDEIFLDPCQSKSHFSSEKHVLKQKLGSNLNFDDKITNSSEVTSSANQPKTPGAQYTPEVTSPNFDFSKQDDFVCDSDELSFICI